MSFESANLPEPLEALVQALRRLPGIGPRSAERLGLHLVQSDSSLTRSLADVLLRARELIRLCRICGAITETDPCRICQSPTRDPSLLCLVERPVDIISLEKAGSFAGKYHVLGGKISPLDGVGPEDLRLSELEQRLQSEPIEELILAMSTDVEGDATCHYMSQRYSKPKLRVSRIAHGLPAGSGLEFADDLTLSRALQGRQLLSPSS